jgi:tRNA(adenine34) deaminase
MCAGAIAESRIKNLYIGTFDPVMGACGSVMNIIQDKCFNHYVNVNWLYNEECSRQFKDFFENVRLKE